MQLLPRNVSLPIPLGQHQQYLQVPIEASCHVVYGAMSNNGTSVSHPEINSSNSGVSGLRNLLAQTHLGGDDSKQPVVGTDVYNSVNVPVSSGAAADLSKKVRSDSATSNTSAADGDGGDSAIALKKPMFRSTKNQYGKVEFALQNRNNGETLCELEGVVIRPGLYMNVHWQFNESDLEELGNSFVIGLVRYGSPFNSPCIIAKSVQINSRNSLRTRDSITGINVVKGKVQFYAPKSAGQFVFRIFDDSSKEKSLVTVATSIYFTIDLTDVDVTSNVKFCLDSFEDKAYQKALTQLCGTIRGLRNSGKPIHGETAQFYLNKCIIHVIKLVRSSILEMEIMESKISTLNVPGNHDTDADAAGSNAGESCKEKEKSVWGQIRQISRLHAESHDTFTALRGNGIAWSLLSGDIKEEVSELESIYCPLLNRYFLSHISLDAGRMHEFGFKPHDYTTVSIVAETYQQSLSDVNKAIQQLLPTLLPSTDNNSKREGVRSRIEAILQSSGIVPADTKIALYGSSVNNFGSDNADVDMCMVFPRNTTLVTDNATTIQAIADLLVELKMLEVTSRATARIPIVNFKDSLTGLDCDISFNNPLAIANTKLLRTYSDIDKRVIELAFIIKHWVKQRHINSPGEGTLSSYGYIICLIHYLQTLASHSRPNFTSSTASPLVPNLQRLPPTWGGTDVGPAASVPVKVLVKHPTEGVECNTYFYSPVPNKPDLLGQFSARNKQSTAELLIGFFHYYAWEFDYRKNVISIQSTASVTKLFKAESNGWNQHDRISIEDPFEVWYDIAHVVKEKNFVLIRGEFLRAYSAFIRTVGAEGGDSSSILAEITDRRVLVQASEEGGDK